MNPPPNPYGDDEPVEEPMHWFDKAFLAIIVVAYVGLMIWIGFHVRW